jgi:hypothetical protein
MIEKLKPKKQEKKIKKPVNKVSSKHARKLVAHALLRDIVILRDKKCVCPPPAKGHSAVLQAGHLIAGTHGGTYFDLWNVHCQCRSCNGRHSPNLGGDEKYYNGWFIRTFGGDAYVRLEKDADKIGLKPHEIEEVILELQAIKDKQLLAVELEKEFKPHFTQQEILSGAWRLK